MQIAKHLTLALAVMMAAPMPAHAQTQGEALEENLRDGLEDLERKADELSETARQTIEDFIKIIGPMLSRFSTMIDGLPAYQAPELMPNGDIIIRRKRPEPVLPGETDENGLTET